MYTQQQQQAPVQKSDARIFSIFTIASNTIKTREKIRYVTTAGSRIIS